MQSLIFIYTKTSYVKLSCIGDTVRDEIRIKNYFYKISNCTPCYDVNCFFFCY